jgi:hypothetical protein
MVSTIRWRSVSGLVWHDMPPPPPPTLNLGIGRRQVGSGIKRKRSCELELKSSRAESSTHGSRSAPFSSRHGDGLWRLSTRRRARVRRLGCEIRGLACVSCGPPSSVSSSSPRWRCAPLSRLSPLLPRRPVWIERQMVAATRTPIVTCLPYNATSDPAIKPGHGMAPARGFHFCSHPEGSLPSRFDGKLAQARRRRRALAPTRDATEARRQCHSLAFGFLLTGHGKRNSAGPPPLILEKKVPARPWCTSTGTRATTTCAPCIRSWVDSVELLAFLPVRKACGFLRTSSSILWKAPPSSCAATLAEPGLLCRPDAPFQRQQRRGAPHAVASAPHQRFSVEPMRRNAGLVSRPAENTQSVHPPRSPDARACAVTTTTHHTTTPSMAMATTTITTFPSEKEGRTRLETDRETDGGAEGGCLCCAGPFLWPSLPNAGFLLR